MAGSETQIEEMQRQLESMAEREQLLIEALNDALEAADRRLLDRVRHVTVEHEVRRTAILGELQHLAGRIGAFPVPERNATTIEYETQASDKAVEDESCETAPARLEKGGDWRKAAEKIGKELECYVSRAGTARSVTMS